MRTSNRRAFTLIEAIIAIIVLAISVPPTFWAIRQAHMNRANPELVLRARWLATEKLEQIVADRHSNTRGYSYLIDANYPAENPVSGYAGFSRTVSITETASDLVTAGTGYKIVRVSVTWTNASAVSRTLTITTVVTDYSA